MRVRALFHSATDFAPGANIWINAMPEEGGQLACALEMAYPDFAPQVGDRLLIGHDQFEIHRVEGIQFTARPLVSADPEGSHEV